MLPLSGPRPAGLQFGDPRLEGEAHVPSPPTLHGLGPRGACRDWLLVAVARPSLAPVRSRHRLRHRHRPARWRRARRDRHRDPGARPSRPAPPSPTRPASTPSRRSMPGQYDISAELDGFKKTTRAARAARRRRQRRRSAFTLEPGALTEVVTVTADAPPLQTDVTVRKTVEAKDIEQLSFSGRNPIGVAGLKAGVIGGNFNNLRLRRASATAASTSTAAAPTRTTSRSTAPPPSAPARPARSSASRTSTRSRKCRC